MSDIVVKRTHKLTNQEIHRKANGLLVEHQKHIVSSIWFSPELLVVKGNSFEGAIVVTATKITIDITLTTAMARMFKKVVKDRAELEIDKILA